MYISNHAENIPLPYIPSYAVADQYKAPDTTARLNPIRRDYNHPKSQTTRIDNMVNRNTIECK